MRFKTILTAIIAWAALAIIVTPNAHADRYLWLGAVNENWSNELNWFNISTFDYPDSYPNGPHDDARFSVRGAVRITSGIAASGCVVAQNLKIDNGTHLVISYCLIIRGRLTIENGGSLTIDCGGTVELAANNRSHPIGGSIFLACFSSKLRISGNATLDPHTPPGQNPDYGKVRGLDNDAAIEICKGQTLTNNITVCGMMTIRSADCSSTDQDPGGATSPPPLRPKVQTQPRASVAGAAGDNGT
ncbi:MAG: hypothetical protein V3W34_16735 [Phycisphaerae bacterium]